MGITAEVSARLRLAVLAIYATMVLSPSSPSMPTGSLPISVALENGTYVQFLRGKPVTILILGEGCPYSADFLDGRGAALQALALSEGIDFKVLYLSERSYIPSLAPEVSRRLVLYPISLEALRRGLGRFASEAIPDVLYVDRLGRLRYQQFGDLSLDQLRLGLRTVDDH